MVRSIFYLVSLKIVYKRQDSDNQMLALLCLVSRAEGWSANADGLMDRDPIGFSTCRLVGRGMSLPDPVTELSTASQNERQKIPCWNFTVAGVIPSAFVIQESVPSPPPVPTLFVPHLSCEFCGCLRDFPAVCERQRRLAVNPHRLLFLMQGNVNWTFSVFVGSF